MSNLNSCTILLFFDYLKFFFFSFLGYHSKGVRNKSYKKAGLYQQRFIGTRVALLATDHTGLTMKWETKNILQIRPVWVRKFRLANLVLSSQSGVFFFLKAWTTLLLSPKNKTCWNPWFLALMPASTIASNIAPHVNLAFWLFASCSCNLYD